MYILDSIGVHTRQHWYNKQDKDGKMSVKNHLNCDKESK